MLGACALALSSFAGVSGVFNISGETQEALADAQQAYFDFVNLGYLWGPEADTTSGKVGGKTHLLEGVDIFWNIPFADDTSGQNRFARPVDPKPWSGTRKSHFPPRWCPQVRIGGFHLGTEDCLHLNVFRPRGTKAGDKLPVMFWIYGGAFVIGDSMELGWYNGKHLAKEQNVIVVSINYRVGSLGFLALDSLRDEQGTAGNWGLLDQRKALQWVQKNIANFGGDPAKVTIFGESAGGCSVLAQLAMPNSHGLYAGAIAESPLAGSDIAWMPWRNASAWGNVFAEKVGCNSTTTQLECLRALPLKEALAAILLTPGSLPPNPPQGSLPLLLPLLPWWPAIDEKELPASPLDQAANGGFPDVPMILGTNKNEGSIFLPVIPLITDFAATYPATAKNVPVVLGHFFNASDVEKIDAAYPPSTGGTGLFAESRRLGHMLRDWLFACAGRALLRNLNSHGRESAMYMYHFEYDMKGLIHMIAGDYHTSELSFVFDNQWLVHTWPLGTWNSNDKKLAHQMGSYWGSFAHGVLNKKGPLSSVKCTAKTLLGKSECISWPTYTETVEKTGNSSHIVFDYDLKAVSGLYQQQCDFWDTQVGYQRIPL